MDEYKIFGVYSLGIGSFAVSVSDINPVMQFLVLTATLAFTVISIIKALKK